MYKKGTEATGDTFTHALDDLVDVRSEFENPRSLDIGKVTETLGVLFDNPVFEG